MKLRLLDDSIRLRLSVNEVTTAAREARVESRTRFPDGGEFVFALEAAVQGEASAAFDGKRMVVRLPAEQIANWANDDSEVTLRGRLALPDGEQLTLLVEKDFQCITPREGEDQSGLFPNPDKNC